MLSFPLIYKHFRSYKEWKNTVYTTYLHTVIYSLHCSIYTCSIYTAVFTFTLTVYQIAHRERFVVCEVANFKYQHIRSMWGHCFPSQLKTRINFICWFKFKCFIRSPPTSSKFTIGLLPTSTVKLFTPRILSDSFSSSHHYS